LAGPATLSQAGHISKHVFWLLLADEELLVLFDQFPCFRKGTIELILEVQWPTVDHLYSPSLDVDLLVQSIRNPSTFPLVSGAAAIHTASRTLNHIYVVDRYMMRGLDACTRAHIYSNHASHHNPRPSRRRL
jgi:hypothetical protein